MKNTVLIVEDDASVRRMIARVLELAGYTTTQAANWREAAALCDATRPGLVLLDLGLACGEGWEMLERIRRQAQGVPVIGLTAWPGESAKVTHWGLDALMEKPLDPGALLRTIQDLLAQADQEHLARVH